MKNKKIILSILLILVLVFGSCSSVYAALHHTVLDELFNAFQAVNYGTQQETKKFIKKSFDCVGFMIDESGILIQKVKDAIHGVDNDFDNNNATDEDVADWITNNVSVVNGDVVYGDKYNEFIEYFKDAYIDDTDGSIFYACGLQESLNSLNATIVADMAEIIEDNPNSYFILINTSPDIWFLVFKENGNKIYGVLNHTYNSSWSDFRLYQAISSNGVITSRTFTANSSDDLLAYRYNGSTQHLEAYTLTYPWNDNAANHGYFNVLPLQDAAGSDWNRYPKAFNTVSQSILTFNSQEELNNYISTYGIGKNPYYINNQTWNNFTSSTGDYTVTSSNVNTVTYGDVISYVNDYHDTNNNYPDNSTVNNWITTTNNNNNGGGGSGGDNGGGSGGSGSEGVFDFLSELGAVLGNLIKNVGQAFTNIIKGISDLISSIVTDLPTVFFDFIGSLFGWLPSEWVTLLSLSLAAMLIWGIVKVIRG